MIIALKKKKISCAWWRRKQQQKSALKSEDMIRAVCCMHAFGGVGMEVA